MIDWSDDTLAHFLQISATAWLSLESPSQLLNYSALQLCACVCVSICVWTHMDTITSLDLLVLKYRADCFYQFVIYVIRRLIIYLYRLLYWLIMFTDYYLVILLIKPLPQHIDLRTNYFTNDSEWTLNGQC